MNYFELQQLAGAALGLTDEQADAIIDAREGFDDLLFEKLGVDFEQFTGVAEALLPLTPTVQNSFTKDTYHAFVRQFGETGYIAIARIKAK